MVKIENHCVDCTSQGLRCMGSACENRKVNVFYCDICKKEIPSDEVIFFDNDIHLCEECTIPMI